MNYADIKKYDTANAIGISTSVYFSGCSYNCVGCFNKTAQDFNYGKEYTQETEDLIVSYAKDSHVRNVSLLGGEPLQQDLGKILTLVQRIKLESNKGIWLWTGGLFEEHIKDKAKLEIFKYIDVLIDGSFEINKKDLALKYRGSSNQRVIDVQRSLELSEVVLYKD